MKKLQATIVDQAGNIVPGAEMYVRDNVSLALVTLYSDNGSTETANPLVSDSDGNVEAFTADATLKLEFYSDGEAIRDPITDYQHYDETDNEIKALRSVTSAADKLFYFTGSGTGDVTALTAFARTVLDDADAATVRTTLGVGTGDSPQFTAVNIGAATDTTVSRVSAGVIAVEGVTILTTATGQPLDATLTALAAYNTNGIICQTAADTFAGRTLTAPAAGITVTNGGGVAGNPTLALADDLNAVEGLSTTGLAARTAASTWTTRTVTAGTGIGVTNGDGVSGNPTIAMSLVGAMVKKSADQTGANYSAGANIAWDAEVYDTSTIHDNATNNSRLTTPAGATYVQVGCNLRFVNVTASTDIILLI